MSKEKERQEKEEEEENVRLNTSLFHSYEVNQCAIVRIITNFVKCTQQNVCVKIHDTMYIIYFVT